MLEVVIGVWSQQTEQGSQYFIGRRLGPSYGNCWEFPGGKVDAGETRREALAREWREELDIGVTVGDPIVTLRLKTENGQEFVATAFHIDVPPGQSATLAVHHSTCWARPDQIRALPDVECTPSLKFVLDAHTYAAPDAVLASLRYQVPAGVTATDVVVRHGNGMQSANADCWYVSVRGNVVPGFYAPHEAALLRASIIAASNRQPFLADSTFRVGV